MRNGNLQVLLGTGSGTFHLRPVFSYNVLPPYVIVVADFNGDGNPDIAAGMGTVVPQFAFAGQVCLLSGQGMGPLIEIRRAVITTHKIPSMRWWQLT